MKRKIPLEEKDKLLEPLAQAARSNKLLLFVGSGMSKWYNLPDWKQMAKRLKMDTNDCENFPEMFSKYVRENGDASFNTFLERHLGRRPFSISPATRLLLEIRSIAIVTTNCDRIIETAAQKLGVPLNVFVNDSDLEDFNNTPWLKLIKLHGTLDQKESLVFTCEQYDAHQKRVPGMRLKVAELIRDYTVLFVGYSLADPDFYNLMDIVNKSKLGHIRQMIGLFSKKGNQRYMEKPAP